MNFVLELVMHLGISQMSTLRVHLILTQTVPASANINMCMYAKFNM